MNEPKPFSKEDLLNYLNKINIEVSTIEHEPIFTVEQSQKLRGDLAGGHTKNLFLKDKKGSMFLLVALEDSQINMKTLHKVLKCARLSFGKADLLFEILGVIPGSVTAFSVINDRYKQVKLLIDERLMRYDIINCHPLINSATTSIKKEDLIKFLENVGHPPHIIKAHEPDLLNG